MKAYMVIAVLFALIVTSACAGAVTPASPTTDVTLQITDIWARPSTMPLESGGSMNAPSGAGPSSGSMSAGNGAVYMTINNSGGAADRLVKAQSSVAEVTEIHNVEMQDGVMKMRPVEFIEVPAQGVVQLKPGGYHVMMIGLKNQLKAGDKFGVTLTFEKSGEKQVEAQVRMQ